MKVVNKSRKIIGIGGQPLLPGYTMELPDGLEAHPSIADYLKKGTLVDADKDISVKETGGISEHERAQIEAEAIAKYKREQEELAAAQEKKKAEIKEVKSMNKDKLFAKATSMGLAVNDGDTVEVLRDKILTVLNQ